MGDQLPERQPSHTQATAGPVMVSYSQRGMPSYFIEVFHDGLHKYQVVRDSDETRAAIRAKSLMDDWDEQWQRKSSVLALGQHKDQQKQIAENITEQAQALHEQLRSLLRTGVDCGSPFRWDDLKDRSSFREPKPSANQLNPPRPEPKPQPPVFPAPPQLAPLYRAPQRSDAAYVPVIGVMDKLIPAKRAQKEAEASALFLRDYRSWEEYCRVTGIENNRKIEDHKRSVAKIESTYRQAVALWECRAHQADVQHRERVQHAEQQWEARAQEFARKKKETNDFVDARARAYREGDSQTVNDYLNFVLSAPDYPVFFPKTFEFEHDIDAGLLVLDYYLPSVDQIPTLTGVKYIASEDKFTEKHIAVSAAQKLYDDVIYQVALRTISEIFVSDLVGAVETVIFNGRVRAIDKGHGREVDACIISLAAKKQDFTQINLAVVDPKACFKQLKGIGSAQLHVITPVPPVMALNKEDERFVQGRAVADGLDAASNLAAMEWEDFEHLIREVFEREFSASGGEVKVTQASRDRGVDAVVFDPDPIRGGKIVIQAKRYTNTVDVSAVRDLYGTVHNEGAIKGILVTTSNFGPDAYQFVQDKPITLLNGGQLLYLLEKHGHKAKIDLREARQLSQARNMK